MYSGALPQTSGKSSAERLSGKLNRYVDMRTFQTNKASWVMKEGKMIITQYSGSKLIGKVELPMEDMAQAVEKLASFTKGEK